MKQLELTEKQLKLLGFEKKKSKGEVWYEIPLNNGCIYFNPKGVGKYMWYLKTTIGEFDNHKSLDIEKLTELFTLLQVFKVQFTMHLFS